MLYLKTGAYPDWGLALGDGMLVLRRVIPPYLSIKLMGAKLYTWWDQYCLKTYRPRHEPESLVQTPHNRPTPQTLFNLTIIIVLLYYIIHFLVLSSHFISSWNREPWSWSFAFAKYSFDVSTITYTCLLLSLQVFQGNSDRDSVHINTLDPPIYARYIRVQPVSYHGWMSLRMELYGCRSGREKLCLYEMVNVTRKLKWWLRGSLNRGILEMDI